VGPAGVQVLAYAYLQYKRLLLPGLTMQVDLAAGAPGFALAQLLYQLDVGIQGITCGACMNHHVGVLGMHA